MPPLTVQLEIPPEMVREEIARQVAARLEAISPTEIASGLDWQPAEWFGRQWGYEPSTVKSLFTKLRVKLSEQSQKMKFYSVSDANTKIAARGIIPPAKRKARIIDFAQPDLIREAKEA